MNVKLYLCDLLTDLNWSFYISLWNSRQKYTYPNEPRRLRIKMRIQNGTNSLNYFIFRKNWHSPNPLIMQFYIFMIILFHEFLQKKLNWFLVDKALQCKNKREMSGLIASVEIFPSFPFSKEGVHLGQLFPQNCFFVEHTPEKLLSQTIFITSSL